MKANNNGWTPERRQRQAQLIHNWKPWENATGATTEKGKEVSKMNALRFTIRGLYRQACRLYRAKNLYMRGYHDQVWAFHLQNEQYMAARLTKPEQRSEKAKYCKKWRKAKRGLKVS
ncbi:hypothetical protein [Thiosulfativibrio zosterae]|uniref:Uncharacterized protein n=1 Tax=Thiosulfativibrio zosterae TaxID=2675053 RepID=A0A6F8PR37_9GAMM|nr:hypothetical protein [Thiosulfativibrio zosterae]BBP44546.1 hypothetical protein THMIRHAT_22920 [Thiosulfativibrio zosterae]